MEKRRLLADQLRGEEGVPQLETWPHLVTRGVESRQGQHEGFRSNPNPIQGAEGHTHLVELGEGLAAQGGEPLEVGGDLPEQERRPGALPRRLEPVAGLPQVLSGEGRGRGQQQE